MRNAEGCGGLLKERGDERSGYRGCLVGSVGFGLIGATGTIWFTRATVAQAPESASFMFAAVGGSVGFVAGAIIGGLVVFLFDLATRRKEHELDEF